MQVDPWNGMRWKNKWKRIDKVSQMKITSRPMLGDITTCEVYQVTTKFLRWRVDGCQCIYCCPKKRLKWALIKIVDLNWSDVICHLEVPHQSCEEHHLLLQGKLDVLGLLQEMHVSYEPISYQPIIYQELEFIPTSFFNRNKSAFINSTKEQSSWVSVLIFTVHGQSDIHRRCLW